MTNTMTNTMVVSHKQNEIDRPIETFFCRHPYASFVAMFIGMPVFILSAVFLCTTAVILPISWIMGWV